jgi:DNA repair ATPase RecN
MTTNDLKFNELKKDVDEAISNLDATTKELSDLNDAPRVDPKEFEGVLSIVGKLIGVIFKH